MTRWWQRSWAVAVSGAFVATVTVLCVARCRSARREAWHEVHERAKAIAAPFVRGIEPHAPLLGTPQPGFADQHYRIATEQFGPSFPEGDEPELYELLDMAELPAGTGARLARHAAALTALAGGVAADQIDYPALHETLEKGVLPATPVVTVALVAARLDLAEGRAANAVQRTADVLTLARDLWRSGHSIFDQLGSSHAAYACQLWSDERLRVLPAAQQRQLGDVLLRLDLECGPATTVAASEAAWLVEHAELEPRWEAEPAQFAAYLTAIAELPADTAPWSVRQPALAAATWRLSGQLASIEQLRRGSIAQVRLLRMAIAHHLGEPVPVLLDPLGDGPLQASPHENGLRFASSGRDADDKPIERIVRAR